MNADVGRLGGAMTAWRIGLASGSAELDAGVLVVVGRGPLTIRTLEALRKLIAVRCDGERVGAVLLSFRCAVLAVTAAELNDSLGSALPAPMAWCAAAASAPMLREHADYAVSFGIVRAVFSDLAPGLAWARRQAAPRLAALALGSGLD